MEDYLIKRFKVISDYPNSPFKIGDIIKFDGVVYGLNEPQCFVRNPEKYPSIFLELEWYQELELHDLPKFVKGITGKIFKVEWDFGFHKSIGIGKCLGIKEVGKDYFFEMPNKILPATEKDFLEQQGVS